MCSVLRPILLNKRCLLLIKPFALEQHQMSKRLIFRSSFFFTVFWFSVYESGVCFTPHVYTAGYPLRVLERRSYDLFSYIFMFPCSCKHVFFFSKSLNRPLNYYNLRQKPPHLVIVIYINLNSLIHSCNLFI